MSSPRPTRTADEDGWGIAEVVAPTFAELSDNVFSAIDDLVENGCRIVSVSHACDSSAVGDRYSAIVFFEGEAPGDA